MAGQSPFRMFPPGRLPPPVDGSMNQNPYMGFMDVSGGVQGAAFDPYAPITPESNAPELPDPAGSQPVLGAPETPTAPKMEQPQGDESYPSAESIARRQKLAEALLGKQMEVNHPMQAVANAVSQISGAYLQSKAEKDEEKARTRKAEQYKKMFSEGGDAFDLEMVAKQLMNSNDPADVERGIELSMKIAESKRRRGSSGGAPTIKTFWNPDGTAWQGQWVEDEDEEQGGRWEKVGEGPRSVRRTGSSGGDSYSPVEEVPTAGGPSAAPMSAPAGDPAGEVDPSAPKRYKTPGPLGKRALQQGPSITGPDGEPVDTVFNPTDGKLYYQNEDGTFSQAGKSSRAPKLMTPTQYVKLRQDYQNEINGMEALNQYFSTVKDIPSGVQRWAIDVTAKAKQLTYGGKTLSPEEFNYLTADAQVQALLGLFRTTIVGPGVMTEYDAIRVLKALGGDPGSALQNPQVMEKILGDLYQRKQRQAQIYYQEYTRQAKARGETPEPFGAPMKLGGDKEGEGKSSAAPAPRGGSKVVLPPKDKRIVGKTEYKAPNGQTYVWGRDASGKVGWVPR